MSQKKFVEFKEISIDQLRVGESCIRKENAQADLDTLTKHIRVNGLLEPVIVFAIDDLPEDHELYESRKNQKGTYEILAGRRRFDAFKRLNMRHPGGGFDRIPCHVRIPPEDEFDAKATSIGENLTQLPITDTDSISACNALFNRHNSRKMVSKKHGISMQLIRKHVKSGRIPPMLLDNLAQIHESTEVSMDIALTATDTLGDPADDPASIQKVYGFAQLLGEKRKKSIDHYKRLIMAAEENPAASLQDIENRSDRILTRTYKITLAHQLAGVLEASAKDEGNTPEKECADVIKAHVGNMVEDVVSDNGRTKVESAGLLKVPEKNTTTSLQDIESRSDKTQAFRTYTITLSGQIVDMLDFAAKQNNDTIEEICAEVIELWFTEIDDTYGYGHSKSK